MLPTDEEISAAVRGNRAFSGVKERENPATLTGPRRRRRGGGDGSGGGDDDDDDDDGGSEGDGGDDDEGGGHRRLRSHDHPGRTNQGLLEGALRFSSLRRRPLFR